MCFHCYAVSFRYEVDTDGVQGAVLFCSRHTRVFGLADSVSWPFSATCYRLVSLEVLLNHLRIEIKSPLSCSSSCCQKSSCHLSAERHARPERGQSHSNSAVRLQAVGGRFYTSDRAETATGPNKSYRACQAFIRSWSHLDRLFRVSSSQQHAVFP
jgi:hypothetical protein